MLWLVLLKKWQPQQLSLPPICKSSCKLKSSSMCHWNLLNSNFSGLTVLSWRHKVQVSEWHFKPHQALSVKGLQISSVEPWNGLILKLNYTPCNIIYDILDQLINVPPLWPVDVSAKFWEIIKCLEILTFKLFWHSFRTLRSQLYYIWFLQHFIQKLNLFCSVQSPFELSSSNPLVDYNKVNKKPKKADSLEVTWPNFK